MSKSIRIRTTPGQSKNVQIKVDQDFDFLEILSLKISQEDLYNTFCANYGVVVGRVIANEGFGVPNSKVSVFVPISSEDEKNTLIKDLYPFKSITSKNKKGIRYNLLLSKATCSLNTAVGTFPTKEEVLNNDIVIEIFDKYYKYTTKTNGAGDYMIFGVPTGQQTVHMDVDLSDAGTFSVRPYDFIDAKGYSEKLFKSRTEFKKSTNLNTLPQIKEGNKGIDVIPFWGDEETCQIGITRVDFDTNFKFEPISILVGSIYTDNGKNSLNKRCNPRNNQGDHKELRTGPGLLEVVRVSDYTYDTPNPTKGSRVVPLTLEEFALPGDGPQSVDDNGAFAVSVPMNLDHVITNEFGDLIPSLDPDKGVATKGMYRFKVNFLEPPAAPKRRTAQLIFPSLNRAVGGTEIQTSGLMNSTENARWSDNIGVWKDNNGDNVDSIYLDFHEFEFNQIYSVSQYMTKYKKGGNRWSFLGVKDVDDSTFNLFPFTTVTKGWSLLYLLIKPIIKLQAALMKLLIVISNFRILIAIKFGLDFSVLGAKIKFTILNVCVEFVPFKFLQKAVPNKPIVLNCESNPSFPQEIDTWACSGNNTKCSTVSGNGFKVGFYSPSCTNTGTLSGSIQFICDKWCIVDAWLCCALYDLAKDRNVIRYTFHDAWLTGTMYLPQFKYKSKVKNQGGTKDKFCGPGGDKLGSNNYKDQKCCGRGINKSKPCDKCVVRGGDKVDFNTNNISTYHLNDYDTGASDIDDMIYCPETYPVKIVNIGRTDACPDVVDRIDRCIVSQQCLLELYRAGGTCPVGGQNTATPVCFTGTFYEQGYDTTQWVEDMGNTTYQDPAMVFIKHMQPCKDGIEPLFEDNPCGMFSADCNECEVNNPVYRDIRQVARLYVDIILSEPPSISEFTGFEFDIAQTNRFNRSAPGGVDPDQEIGSAKHHHLANSPYFYFGLTNGSTAMDKLRKLYLVEKENPS